ncbi:CUB domain-containing protein [Luteibaculum oceani]|uniref:T9SS type B sorting domain-containing protein n=1 Tax=Luteibaculum oceani TaxID=1294296 RepID=A0A5C6VAX9_9FLAO|nr:CUB domain-containing protein [Luteibaculum oceani]TXC82040.1 hypothetical protein FRX97_02810 [Luteibaculum oceani]
MKFVKSLLSCLFLFTAVLLYGQPTYNMGNFTVSDCEGILLDSEVGNADNPTGYDHNENYTFTICVPGASSVTITFELFELEKASSGNVKLDILSIYQGPDRTGPLIGEYTGDQNPGTITITGECVTIHFVSDASVNAEGWRMRWVFDPPDPVPPTLAPIPNVTCESTSVTLQFDRGIVCNQINTQNFNLSGPTGSIASVTGVGCSAPDDTTSTVIVNFDRPLDESGRYTVTCDVVYFDMCGRPFQFTLSQTFDIVDCPLDVEILGDTIFCEGDCVDLFADVTGGDFNNYQYTWQPAGPNNAVNRVCPTDSITTYIVTVTDGNSIPSSDTIVITRIPRPTMPANFSICRFDADTFLSATPTGGFWSGPGMNAQGRFRPPAAGAGTRTVAYTAPNGCPNTMDITVHPIQTPWLVAVCVNTDSVLINGTPAGGTWTGDPQITSTGYFSSTAGTGDFVVTYTEPNFGCQKTTTVRVVDSITVPTRDSIIVCVNQAPFDLQFAPAGGYWQGPGVNWGGRFNPGNAGPGKHVLWYTINGCVDTTTVEVFDINAGVDTVICPSTNAFALTGGNPANGIWSGTGVTANIDSSVFTFNTPQFAGKDTNIFIYYTLGGCTDARIFYLRETRVDNSIISVCDYDSIAVIPTASLNPSPANGVWFGTDFSNDTLDIRNKPTGSYYVYYEFQNNGCLDSVEVQIRPKPSASTPAVYDTICPREVDFDLTGTPAGGVWRGIGIKDPSAGTFSPTQIGFSGVFESIYSLGGCEDTTRVVVRVPVLNISGLAPVYCFEQGRVVNLIGTPSPGTFYGPGVNPSNNTFEPGVAGSGDHYIKYVYGSGACEYVDSTLVTVEPPIQIDSLVYADSICFGASTSIEAFVSGGRGLQSTYKLDWEPTDFGGSSRFNIRVTLEETTTYRLIVRDKALNYCSYADTAYATITVNPKITYDAYPGPTVCFGDTNTMDLYGTSVNPLSFTWARRNQDSVATANFRGPAGTYAVRVRDLATGCYVDSVLYLPQYPYLEANIIKVPSQECISILDPTIHIVNATVGATGGSWDMGDTSGVKPFFAGENFSHTYTDTGVYQIKLYVYNGGGLCVDSASVTQCIEKISKIFLSNTFTPNGDTDNDTWPTGGYNEHGNWVPLGYDIVDFEYMIFDRWGRLVFNSEDTPGPWNGNYLNRTVDPVKPGVYTYVATVHFDKFNIQQITGTVTLLR